MANPKEVEIWLNKAKEDFEFSSSVLPETNFYAQVCFFFQQAAEKYLKAYIVKYELEFKKIHDLTELLEICKSHNPAFSKLLEECALLNAYYIEPRYPVHWPTKITKKDALKAQEATQKIKELVEKLLEEE